VVSAPECAQDVMKARDLADGENRRHGESERRCAGEDRLSPVDPEDLVVAPGHLYARSRPATTLQLQ
jgi:hypothetical protein